VPILQQKIRCWCQKYQIPRINRLQITPRRRNYWLRCWHLSQGNNEPTIRMLP